MTDRRSPNLSTENAAPGSLLWELGITISVLMPVHRIPVGYLNQSINSILQQSYSGWELCVCADSSNSSGTMRLLESLRGSDPRIKIVHARAQIHPAKATNVAAEFATGSFIALLNPEDWVEPDALKRLAETIQRNPAADLVYVDEEKVSSSDQHGEPCLRPDWSRELLLSTIYIGRFLVVRKSIFLALGGLREKCLSASHYDLALRVSGSGRQIMHVAGVLVYSRGASSPAGPCIDEV